jgi:molybdate transport repressor ModE-like protein
VHTSLAIEFDATWLTGEGLSRDRARTLLRLLADLERSRSLREAAGSVGVSYRFAWGALGEASRLFGGPLVHMQRGRGARLTPLGRKVIEVDRHVRRELADHHERLRRQIPLLLSPALPAAGQHLALYASHDLALSALPSLCAPRLQLDIAFRGSDDCLAALARGECQLAGFHVADALPRAAAAAAALGKWLDRRKHVLVHFVTREQGLMVRPGSRIRSVHDLARPGVRFIHRQNSPGAAAETPVAESVAAGRADAAFGLRADASRLKLSFVPLAVERYFLACAKGSLRAPAFQTLLEVLSGPAFAARVARLPGYDASDAGTQHALDAALTWVEKPRDAARA